MKKEFLIRKLAMTALVGGLSMIPVFVPQAQAQVDLSANINIQSPADFYSPLAPYGSWVNVASYGQCWRPAGVAVGWQPYTMGHWEWTDAGWYWVSDEPWGWACFHYGQWVADPVYGWVWVPGTQWAPAWVVWREAPDYVGWAPCGPGGAVFSDNSFVFVDVHHFHDRLQPRELVFNDPRIFRSSRAVGGFRTERRDWDGRSRMIAYNPGPGVEPIQQATGTRFTQRPVRELIRQNPVAQTGRIAPNERSAQRPTVAQQPRQTTQPQQRLYREAPKQTPAPTGRQDQRIYREAPSTQTVPQSPPTASELPRRQTVPELPRRPAIPPQERPLPQTERSLPPTGLERSRPEAQVPRRPEQIQQAPEARGRAAEPPARVAPAPAPQRPPEAAPNNPPRREGRERDRDGQ